MVLLYCLRQKKKSNGRKSNKENEVKKKWNEYCARSVLVQCSSKIGESWDGNAMSGKKTPKEHQITKICKQTSKCNQSEQCLSSFGIVEVCKVWQTHWAKIIEKERHQKDLHTKWYKQISLYANEVDILFLSSPYCLNGMLFLLLFNTGWWFHWTEWNVTGQELLSLLQQNSLWAII